MLGKVYFNLLNAALFTMGFLILFLGFFMNLQDEVPLAGVAVSRLHQSSFLFGVFGVVVIGTAILGFFGVNQDIRFFTGIYTILLGLAVVVFLALGVYIVTNRGKMALKIDNNIKTQMNEYYNPSKPKVKKKMDKIQTTYECCGIRDTNRSLIDVFGNHPIPKTCCDEHFEGNCTLNNIFEVGCDEQLQAQLNFLAIPLVALSFTCSGYCAILMGLAIFVKKKDEDAD